MTFMKATPQGLAPLEGQELEDYEAMIAEREARKIPDAKYVALSRLKRERDEIEAEPVNGFQCSRPQDIIKIEKAIINFDNLADPEGKILWKMSDNTYLMVTKAEMQALDPLQVEKVAKAYNAEAIALQALEYAMTQEEISSISVRGIYESL